jgi:hypothetical protein
MVATTQMVRKLAFMAMPLESPDLNALYACFLRPGLTLRCGLECLRADEMLGSSDIVTAIREAIEKASIVVADVTGANGNVLYEIGLADGAGIPVLLIAQGFDELPFDLRGRRIVRYAYTPAGCHALELALPNHVLMLLGGEGGNGAIAPVR